MVEKTRNPHILQAYFLGNQEISIDGVLIDGLSSQKAKALIIYLIYENKQVHPRTKLASLFWPDVPEQTALHNLRQALVLIKKSIESIIPDCELVLTTREDIRLNPEINVKVDALTFSSELKSLLNGLKGLPERGFPIQKMERILMLRQAEFLSSFSLTDSDLYEDWLTINRESINHLAIQGESLLLHYYESRGEWMKASRCAEKLTRLAPWDEYAHSRLIFILLRLSQSEAALAHYHHTDNYFRNELGIELSQQMHETLTMIEDFRQGKNNHEPTPDVFEGLPRYSTTFIGRKDETEKLEEWISDLQSRVITITGPGGSGKTRLAAFVAETQVSLFRDGVYFIAIDGCYNIQQIATRILNSIGDHSDTSYDAFEELLEWAESRKAMLVLDNVESCNETSEFTAKLIAKATSILLLFTSYSRLGLIGERVLALQGLPVVKITDSIEHPDAIQLFLSHLQYEKQPGMDNPGFIKKVAEICELVEGLPLAIDLAAGQVRQMPVDQLLVELNHNLDVLKSKAANMPERHRSIEASFENAWSHLAETRRRALTLLTYFQTPFTAQAAESIFGIHCIELRELAGDSLLTWDAGERYRFHRAIGLYAREKLEVIGVESKEYETKYADWFYEQISKNFSSRIGDQFQTFLMKIEVEISDYLKTIKWLINNKIWDKVQLMIFALFTFFEGRSYYRQGSEMFLELSSLCEGEESALKCQVILSSRAALLLLHIQQFDHAARLVHFSMDKASLNNWCEEIVFGYNVLANEAMVKKDSSTAEKYALKGLELARKEQLEEEEAHALYNLSYARINKGDLMDAGESLEQCRMICMRQKNWRRLSKVLNSLADIACFREEFQQALDYYNEAVQIARSLGNKYSESLIMNNIGTVYMELHDYSAAEDYLLRSVELCREIDDQEGIAVALSNLGEIAVDQQDFRTAIKYCEESIAISVEIGSDWAEMSARIVLAEAWRKLGDLKKARIEVTALLTLANKTVSMNFYHRAVFEACSQLTLRDSIMGVPSILRWSIQSEGIEGSTRIKSQTLLDQLPAEDVSPLTLEVPEILAFLCQQLMKD